MQVSQQHFGVIYSGYPSDQDFFLVLEAIGGTLSRYPGGTLSELDFEVYDVSREEPFDPTYLYSTDRERARLGLDEFLAASSSTVIPTVIMPTYRYMSEPDRLSSDVSSFLTRLLESDTEKLRIEIGNEYYAIPGFFAADYTVIAEEIVEQLASFQSQHPNLEIEIIVQLGRTSEDNDQIISGLSQVNQWIDGLAVHSMPINIRNLYRSDPAQLDGIANRFDHIGMLQDGWETRFGRELDLHMSAWAVGAAATNADEINLIFQDYGARGGVTALAIFTEALALGAESMSAWGVGVENLNSLGLVVDGAVQLSHAGQVLAELHNSVIGYSYSHGAGDFTDFDSSSSPVSVSFVSQGSAVLYVVIPHTPEVGAIEIALGDILVTAGTNLYIDDVLRISTQYRESYVPMNSEEDRLHEIPLLTEIDDFVFYGSSLAIDSTQAFDIFEITVSWFVEGTLGDDYFEGEVGTLRYDAREGDDTVIGRSSDDTLLGGSGSDFIRGGSGDDMLIGDCVNMTLNDYFIT